MLFVIFLSVVMMSVVAQLITAVKSFIIHAPDLETSFCFDI